ncbi:hypothetical protein SAMN02744778_04725 [Pantoea sp. GL120224-02]|nr:hypothetical protein SAMN02744778_04725 [Pantoea sp. GL120224-02]
MNDTKCVMQKYHRHNSLGHIKNSVQTILSAITITAFTTNQEFMVIFSLKISENFF